MTPAAALWISIVLGACAQVFLKRGFAALRLGSGLGRFFHPGHGAVVDCPLANRDFLRFSPAQRRLSHRRRSFHAALERTGHALPLDCDSYHHRRRCHHLEDSLKRDVTRIPNSR